MTLEGFFNPKSIAVVGASRTEGKVGHEILENIKKDGFTGGIYPINPSADEVEGLKCYPDLHSLPEVPELVVVVVPAKFTPGVMEDCAKLGVKSVIIISAGYREIGEEGLKLEQEVVQIAKRAGIRFIGPNCLGLMVPDKQLNASFGGELPEPGGIGYISQSGALLTAIIDMAKAHEIGFSTLVSIGNKADVDELDVMMHLGSHEPTKVIAGYLESINDGDAFVRYAEKISHEKPVLLIKSGGTEAGARAASSHTGSLAGGETAYDVVFDRAGIIRCDSIESQFEWARAFAYQPIPAGNSVAIITNAGGPGIMAADAIEREDLTFAKLSDETMASLAEKLPAAANVTNPVDVLGDSLADRYEHALEVVLDDPSVDIVLVLLTPQAMTECEATAEVVVRLSHAHPDKTMLACFMGAGKVHKALHILRHGNVPDYDSPESAVATIRAMCQYGAWKKRPKRVVKLFTVNRHKVDRIISRHLRRGEREIGETESKEILEAYGFVTPKGSVATTAEQAASIADQLGYPVVLKIWSPDIIHKSDVGGVKVGLVGEQAVMDAFDLMMYRIPQKQPDADIMGVLVQEMCSKGKEVILGMYRDPRFGPMLMFGMGGIMVEVLKDVAFYLAPITAEEARRMLVRTRTFQILKGVRGQKGVDIDKIAEGIQRLSQLVTEFPQIQEMDINPFVIGPEGTTPIAVDARISVEEA